jgi:uncharacterized repeat protein (TIGR04052 family)
MKVFPYLSLLCAIAALPAVAQSGAMQVRIAFQATLGGKAFACGEVYEGVGLKHSTVTPEDLRFYISNVRLLDTDGRETPVALDQDGIWQYQNLALLDFEDGTGGCRNGNSGIHREITGTVPQGSYTAIRFDLGVPFQLDHIDPLTAPSPLNMTAMLWSWQNGYKFVRTGVETARSATQAVTPAVGQATAGGATRREHRSSGFPVHLGSTACASAGGTAAPQQECVHPNRPTITLTDYDSASDVILFNLDHLFAGSDVSGHDDTKFAGCMSFESNDNCAPIMAALGLPFRDAPAPEQSVFELRKHRSKK